MIQIKLSEKSKHTNHTLFNFNQPLELEKLEQIIQMHMLYLLHSGIVTFTNLQIY